MSTRSTSRARMTPSRTQLKRKNGRRALPRTLAQANLAQRERMIEGLCRVILEYADNSGVAPKLAARAFAKARRSVGRSPYRLCDALDFEVMLRMSEAFKAWYAEPKFLDARGAPAPLPLRGRRSFETLTARFLPEFKALDIAHWFIDQGLLQRANTDLLLPRRRSVVFPRPNAMTLDRVPFILKCLLSTVHHNTQAKRKPRDTRCEQLLTLDRFRVADLPRFHREIQKRAPDLLDQVESWAAPYLEPEGSPSRGKTARVCVELFASSETSGARRKRGRTS
ncbi:MAG: hypothetical protein M3N19_05705 [Candidatus Eremiobacteraeota bacterium]|nr:hypothetical protein [Candidatus Eremiobacteraeota bacterium]